MKKILNLIRWFAFSLAAFIIICYSSFMTNADVNNIRVSGNKRISDETVLLISELSHLSEISANSINEALKKLKKSGL